MLIKDRYEYDPAKDLIGKGGFARVFRARDTLLDREVALKVFSHTGDNRYTVLDEIRKAIRLEHRNLLRYYDVMILDQSNALGETEHLQIGVMEYANGGDLKNFVRKNPNSPHTLRLLREVLHGLEYLHSQGIIHRDMKAQNILLVERGGEVTAKISDFGISKALESDETRDSSMLVGTIEYMAPEQFNPRKFGIDGKIRPNVDLWGFGVMVHELLTDNTPFGRRDSDTTAEQIMASILSPTLPKEIDELAEPYRTVVKKCLIANAKERIQRASDLLADLGEPGYAPNKANEAEETRFMPLPSATSDETQFLAADKGELPPGLSVAADNAPTGSKTRISRNVLFGLGAFVVLLLAAVLLNRGNDPESVPGPAPAAKPVLLDSLAGAWRLDMQPPTACKDPMLVISRQGDQIKVGDGAVQAMPKPHPEGWVEIDGSRFRLDGDVLTVGGSGGEAGSVKMVRCPAKR